MEDRRPLQFLGEEDKFAMKSRDKEISALDFGPGCEMKSGVKGILIL